MNIFKENVLQRLAIQTAILVTLCCICACNKDEIDDPILNPDCKITSVTLLPDEGTPETVNFIYDDNGRLKYINSANWMKEYFYEPNGFKQITTEGTFSIHSFVELNAVQLPITKKDTTYGAQGGVTQTSLRTFEYNNQGKLIEIVSSDPAQPEEKFTWANDNLVKYQIGNTIYIMDYYTDKLNMDFTLINLQFFLAVGINPARSKNLLKSLTSNDTQLIFDYHFDADGNIKDWNAVVLGEPDPSLRGTQSVQCN